MENKIGKGATFKEVRKELMLMQGCGGSAMRPLILNQIFFELLENWEKKDDNRGRARYVAEIFAALCNEQYLACCYDKNAKTTFIMTEAKWDKYCFGQNQRNVSLKYLEDFEVIRSKTVESPITSVTAPAIEYEIDLDMLQKLRRMAEGLKPKKKS